MATLATAELREPGALLRDPDSIPGKPGLYAWYFDDALAWVRDERCLVRDGWTLLYVGLAGSHAGSERTLRDRLMNHLTSDCSRSTLRRTVAALLERSAELRHGRSTSARRASPS